MLEEVLIKHIWNKCFKHNHKHKCFNWSSAWPIPGYHINSAPWHLSKRPQAAAAMAIGINSFTVINSIAKFAEPSPTAWCFCNIWHKFMGNVLRGRKELPFSHMDKSPPPSYVSMEEWEWDNKSIWEDDPLGDSIIVWENTGPDKHILERHQGVKCGGLT